jgi:hypothetical protein
MMMRYGAEAGLKAARRADELLAEGDTEGAKTWCRILKVIEKLHAKKLPEGEAVNSAASRAESRIAAGRFLGTRGTT